MQEKKPNIPVPPVTDMGACPSHTQQKDPPEDSDEQIESQQTESDHGGDGGNGNDEEEADNSVKTTSEPNRKHKRKTPKAEEVNKPQSRKKTKSSKDKNIVEEAGLTSEDLAQALSKSIETLTQKWSEFVDMHLQALTGVAKHVSELKDLVEKSLTGASVSSAPVSAQPDLRQWPARENKGQVSSASLIITDATSHAEMSMVVGIDYTKMSMTELHLCQSAIAKEIQA